MYCGDETGAFVGEIGGNSCRFGYGGEGETRCSYACSHQYDRIKLYNKNMNEGERNDNTPYILNRTFFLFYFALLCC